MPDGGLIASVVTPHTPRMGVEEQAPEFVKGMIGGIRELGDALRALNPDLIVLQSAHWVATFNWFVTAHEVHEGFCIADEAPDLIPGLPYRYKGDPEFAHTLAETIAAAGVPCGIMDSPHYQWDYGQFVPLRYLDPQAAIPVVTLPTVICADLTECMRVGGLVHEAAARTGRRVVFISSCALSHEVVRGPENWPSDELQALDRRLVKLLCGGHVRELMEWVPAFCKDAVAEMGGRTLCGMIGAVEALASAAGPVAGRQFGPYGQSSGSGNVTVCVTPANA